MADPIVEGRLGRMIAALRREGPRHILEVLRHHRRRVRWAAREESLPDPDRFLSPIADSNELIFQLRACSDRAASLVAPWLLDGDQRDRTLRRFDEDWGDEITEAASQIATGRFTLLGLSIFEPSGRFDWHRDYSSGKTWTRERFDRIRFLQGDGSDVKYPWELSRMTWIGALGLAHQINPEKTLPRSSEVPFKAFQRLLSDWIEENEYNRGVNWAMPMEVALRSFWLLGGLALFGDTIPRNRTWWKDYVSLLAGHGRSLHHTLEYLPNLTNHYVADCFGLLALGALFNATSEGRQWFEDGRERLERELRRQVTSDGLHYERSLPYHGLVLELYLTASLISERAGKAFSRESLEIIDRMVDVVSNTIPAPGRRIPLLGDADDGRLLRILPTNDLYDLTFLLDLFRSRRGTTPDTVEGTFLLGSTTGSREAIPSVPHESRLFREGGIAVFRNRWWTIIIDVGPIGLHGNNDTLSFALYSSDGTPWIIDPGTPCYTGDPELRNEFRSTAAHDTVMVDLQEIAEYAGLWRVREDRTDTEVLEFDSRQNRMIARHHAYDRLESGGVIHEREFRLEGTEVHIVDRLYGKGEHRVSCRFTFDPEIELEGSDKSFRLRTHPSSSGSDEAEFLSSQGLTRMVGEVAPSYGLLLPTEGVQLDDTMSLPVEIAYLCRFRSDRGRED